mmetsp:Transcript_67944/g.167801  ORF Transcript_67944/g.167801 Transcript_67944/m.167801 type:complete len:480 (-) Transcript_67944:474-1913(-)
MDRIPAGEPAEGLPSDRVLGMPVAAAMHPLPETCCSQQACFSGKKVRILTPAKRRFLWRASLLAAATTIMLTACADALSSKTALWQAAVFYDEAIVLRPEVDPVPAYYVDMCRTGGRPPMRVEISFFFLIIAVVMSFLGTVFLLIVSQGSTLCCAPCACCDATAKTMTALGLAIPLVLASIVLLGWNMVLVGLDMTNCHHCREMSFRACAAGFSVREQYTGISVAGGICGAAALSLAGFYCLMIPRAIQDAVRFKARNMTAMQSSISLNTYIGVRAMAVSPNLVPSHREAAVSSARNTPNSGVGTRPGSAGQPSPFGGYQPYQFNRTVSGFNRSVSGGSWGSNPYNGSNAQQQASPLIISMPPRDEIESPPSRGSGGIIPFGHRVPLSQVRESESMPRMVASVSTVNDGPDGQTSYVLRASDVTASDTVWTSDAVGADGQEVSTRRHSSLVSMNFEQIAGRFTVLSASLEHEAPNSMEH